jgi:hypothetical protein
LISDEIKIDEEGEFPDDLFGPRPEVRKRRVGVPPRDSTPREDTLARMRVALGLISEGVPVMEACSLAGLGHSTYKETKNWMKRNLSR